MAALTKQNRSKSTSLMPRALAALFIAGFVLMMSSSAFALDGYADRKGVFVGLGVGGGIGAVANEDDGITNGLGDGRKLGLSLHGIIGGGVNKNIVLGLGVNTWIRNVEQGSQDYHHQHWNFLANGNFFLIDGLYIDAGAGLAYASYDATIGPVTQTYNEMGLALRGGLGYEFFLNGTHALGMNVGYTRHFYFDADAAFDTIGATIGIRWY
ncbi:hypothetical protein [Bradymonas sediminis]|nr:hypothetical protein [Bradymonas sediminis]TDP73716.1 hypothetical protein DFR33_10548 [Bradymonas sediminis]